ncbi:MAG: response regulator [Azoarcus sp.]|jgi:putative two-component system response regulator|nr:response regulator [Azoarcus sp.]
MEYTVLVVDDNRASRECIYRHLQDECRVILATSGEQALKVCSKMRPDLILLAIEMAGMGGFEVLERLGERAELSTIPVIFLSTDNDTETEIRGLERGAADFIVKPVNKSILLYRIGHHLRFHRYQHLLEENVRDLEGGIVLGFAEIVEFRDANTGGHVGRSSRYVQILGKTLRKQSREVSDAMSEGDLDMIVRAAPLHDIGKIGIRDRILLKPGPLSEGEFEIMKTHSTLGGEILRRMYWRTPTQHYLKFAIQIAESHHERFDGSGYPKGLRGDEIPLCARIMAVADVYDAVTGNRCYRQGLSHEQTRGIIVDGAGTHFDPRLVEVFLKVETQFEQEFNLFRVESGGIAGGGGGVGMDISPRAA